MDEEKRIIEEFIHFIKSKKNKQKQLPKLFHWAHAENTFLTHANLRHNDLFGRWLKEEVELIDMCKIFMKEPILIKGMLKFKLKEVAKAMYNNKMITTKWEDNGVNDGLTAMIGACNYYKDKTDENKKLMEKIGRYNDIDVKVLWEIVNYLRKNNCS